MPLQHASAPVTDLRRLALDLLVIAVVAALYVLLADMYAGLYSVHGRASITWFAEGFGLAMLLLFGKRRAWGIFIGEIIFHGFVGDESWTTTLVSALGNTLAALFAAWGVGRDRQFDLQLLNVRSYVNLVVLAGGGASVINALIGVSAMLATGEMAAAQYPTQLLAWWIKDMVGVSLVTPLVLVWWRMPRVRMGWARAVEAVLFLATAFLVGQTVLVGWFQVEVGLLAQSYWLVVVIVWAALRFRHQGVTLALALFSVQGLLGAGRGVGIFSDDAAQTGLVNYALFLMVLSGVGLMLSIYLSEVLRAHAEISQREEAYYRQFSDSSAIMLLMHKDGRILDANKAALRFYGYASREDMQHLTVRDISCRPPNRISASLQAIAEDEASRFESRHRLADGSERDVDVSLSPIMMADQPMIHNIVFDITDRKRAEAEIEQLAFYDTLTHLPNRRLLVDRLRQSIAASVRSRHHGALLFIDLDNFKTVNDTHGHAMGDLLLQQAAQRLSACARAGDTVARLGGDEFVVMLKDQSENLEEAAAQVAVVGDKVVAELTRPFDLKGVEHHGSASVGVALFGNGTDSVDDIFKRADLAMYEVKASGRNGVRFFDPAMQATLAARAELYADMRMGLREGQFVLHYQPQVDEAGRLTGAEALVRWQHPDRGMVPPAEFISVAEENGLILPLGRWVLNAACAQLATWAAAATTAPILLSINVSARQFNQPEFVAEVMGALHGAGAPVSQLKIELTESMLLDDVESVIAKMTELKALGVGFSLDDFGTGYSSLSYLKRLPLDQLKIDQSFVRDLLTDPKEAAIAKTIVALGHSLGLTVIAEGVETAAQRQVLQQLGCHFFQGYFFGRPAPADQLATFIANPGPG